MPAVERLMHSALAKGVFPGAVLLVDRGGELLAHAAYGVADRFTGQPVVIETVFDLASLTKPLATALAIMRLHQQGRLGVEERLGEVLPAYEGGDKRGVTVGQLLSHTAGLPDYRPYYSALATRPAAERRGGLRERLVAEPLVNPPGERMLYSDLDFMILEWVVEAVCGRRLDSFVAEEVYGPLGAAESLFFVDLNRPPLPVARFAATEQCPAALHGNLSQNNRQRAIEGFRAGRYKILVATDIAARGIDVCGVSHVINYDIPATADAYTHRIGRTGRACATGEAITFVGHEDQGLAREIGRLIGGKLKVDTSRPAGRLPAERAPRPSAPVTRPFGSHRRTGGIRGRDSISF